MRPLATAASPVSFAANGVERVTTFCVPAARWSDGTSDPTLPPM
ncbi:MAG: hypothetical protein ABI056_07200 [Caulobacteraceae bacterium]